VPVAIATAQFSNSLVQVAHGHILSQGRECMAESNMAVLESGYHCCSFDGFSNLGPVSRKPWKLFGPVKPFLVHLYLKTEKCIHLKLLV